MAGLTVNFSDELLYTGEMGGAKGKNGEEEYI